MKSKSYSYYSHKRVDTLKELLDFCTLKQGDKTAFIYYNNKKERISISYNKFKSDVDSIITAFFMQGYKGSHIAVLGENSYEWILTYFAVTCGSNVIVPIDKDLSASEIKAILIDSRCSAIVYSNTYLDIVDELQIDCLVIDYINMKDLPSLIDKGQQLNENRNKNENSILPDDLAAIVYTSGTTGKSKGVMLTHKNLAIDTVSTCENVYIAGGTILLLPLHHTFGLVAGVFCVLLHGHSIFINRSFKNITNDFLIAKPQHLSIVPMVVESLHRRIWDTAEKQGKAKLLKLLIKVSNGLLTVGFDVRHRLFKSVLSAFGGELELIVSGGAPIEDKYIDGFKDFGITIINGYGITECAPVLATNRNNYLRSGTVGFPLSCCQVKIYNPDENGIGEILVKGDNVMQGYYNDPVANSEAFDGNWFKTGDLGKFDNDGFLYITGRIKNLIILSNGKNVCPEELEGYIFGFDEVNEVMVYASNDIITAEIFPDYEIQNCENLINYKIKELNKKLPIYKQIGKMKFREKEFEKTTTKKIKRYKVGVNVNA